MKTTRSSTNLPERKNAFAEQMDDRVGWEIVRSNEMAIVAPEILNL
jgi:hypothetical protein